jgi:hypothetical protein
MHINVPLLPLSVEFRWRPLRPMRFSIRGIMLVVVLAGIFLALIRELHRQGRAMSYHAEQSFVVLLNRTSTYDPTPLSNWHAAQCAQYQIVVEILDLLIFLFVVSIGAVLALFAIGRIVAWLVRRSHDRRATNARNPVVTLSTKDNNEAR